jgi:hypothetical protein
LAGSLVVKSFIVTLRQLLWVARPSLKSIVVTRRASNSSSWADAHDAWFKGEGTMQRVAAPAEIPLND